MDNPWMEQTAQQKRKVRQTSRASTASPPPPGQILAEASYYEPIRDEITAPPSPPAYLQQSTAQITAPSIRKGKARKERAEVRNDLAIEKH
ncbi:hypothetical protein HK097_006087, partial [Rhizophlyctis rosea]